MLNLDEREMRLLVGIVLDAAQVVRESGIDEDSEIVALSGKLVKMVNKMYPVAKSEEVSIFGIE